MYALNIDNIRNMRRRMAEPTPDTPHPMPWRPMPRRMAEPTPDTPHPMPWRPMPRWSGGWKPRSILETRAIGSLGDSTSADPETYAPATPQPSAWSNLWSGLASIITPAAQVIAQTRANAVVQQQQQRALAQTWNPAITAPAIQAQAWQTAYQSGTGAAPLGLGISTGTLILGGIATLAGLYLITRKK